MKTENHIHRGHCIWNHPRRARLVACLIVVAALALPSSTRAQSQFIRADSNDDGNVNIADVVCTLLFLFGGDDGVCQLGACLDARDSNDDGQVNISDALFHLIVFFTDGQRRIPPPFPDCGLDPTPGDPLGCDVSNVCGEFDGFTLQVGPETKLFSIWSEGYDTAPDQHAVLSVIHFRGGSHKVFIGRDTENLSLIESLAFGPDLTPATPLGTGKFSYHDEQLYPYEYRQSFETPGGEWTFQLSYRGKAGPIEIDCDLLDGESFETNVLFLAELQAGDKKQNIHYSCFSPEIWMPARGATPRRLTLDDGTTVELEMEEAYLFRGVAGETANRRLSGATVELGGETVEVTTFEQLIYAGLHHNSQQEFRVLFDTPRGSIHGIDVIDCPPGVGPPFFCYLPTIGESKAYFLNEALDRTTELTVTAAAIGGLPE